MVSDYALNVALVVCLTLLSQLFAGLNIGLLSLDTAQLQALIDVPGVDGPGKRASRSAQLILPLRQWGNVLMCTILLGNVAVNVLLALLLSEYLGPLFGWMSTTAIVLLLCKILPQSTCARYGLHVGAATAPIIWLAMFLLYPLTKPYAMMLDRVFPQSDNLLDRRQLRVLFEAQQQTGGLLSSDQAALERVGRTQRPVEEIMRPLTQVFKLHMDDQLDRELLEKVVREGFSRFPVVEIRPADRYGAEESVHVEGVLHCKDLLKHWYRPEQHSSQTPRDGVGDESPRSVASNKTVRTVGDLVRKLRARGQENRVYVCGKQTRLLTLLNEFKSSRHLAVVADIDDPGEAVLDSRTGLPVRHVAIVTLQDVCERLLDNEAVPVMPFVPEQTAHNIAYTSDMSNMLNVETPPPLVQPVQSFGTVRALARADLTEITTVHSANFGLEGLDALARFVAETDPAHFGVERLSPEDLLALLRVSGAQWATEGKVLYQCCKPASHATLVVQGVVRVVSGDDGFESTEGPWAILGAAALSPQVFEDAGNADAYESAADKSVTDRNSEAQGEAYVPDFSAEVVAGGDCLTVCIERDEYLRACAGTLSSPF